MILIAIMRIVTVTIDGMDDGMDSGMDDEMDDGMGEEMEDGEDDMDQMGMDDEAGAWAVEMNRARRVSSAPPVGYFSSSSASVSASSFAAHVAKSLFAAARSPPLVREAP